MKILGAGDLQIGSGLSLTDDRLEDQARMWAWIVQEAREHEVDALVIPGDIWHRYPPTPAEYLAFWEPLRDFSGIQVIACPGNHDSGGADRPTGLDVLSGPGLTVLDRPGWRAIGGGSVAALPWAPIARLVAEANGGSRDDLYEEAARLLIEAGRGLRADIVSAGVTGPSVLMAHWSVSGAVFADGRAIEEFMREPILPVRDLESLGFDAVIAGHIHKAQLLWDEPKSVGLYTGSPWVGDWSEADSEHVVWHMEITDEGVAYERIPVPDRKFITVDASRPEEILIPERDECEGAVVRVKYSATAEEARRMDDGEIVRRLVEYGAHHAIVKPQIEREDRARVEDMGEDMGPLEMLERWIESQGMVPEAAEALRVLTAGYLEGEAV